VRPVDAKLVRERGVWRLENGRAALVGYRIYCGPDGHEPRLPGVTPRCQYSLEILVILAFLVYVVGISLDKACVVLAFFCQLPLSKSQADAVLRQFVRHWEAEFETNNLTGRLQRGPALDRKAGRTSKTAAGARCRSVIVSMLESLRANLEQFTLASVLQEASRWMAEGVSLFQMQ
jgi:hypothetical protein